MNLMNGKEIWCRPAPIRTRKVQDIEVVKSSRVLLAEMPRLIEEAIKRGLVYRPEIEPIEKIGRMSVIAVCQKCGLEYAQSRSSKYVVCHVCRLNPVPCKACGTIFQPKVKKNNTCSAKCQQDLARLGAMKRSDHIASKRPMMECPVCRTLYRARWNGGKLTKTCSQSCGITMMANKKKQIRKGEII